jgi:hypothetical protein
MVGLSYPKLLTALSTSTLALDSDFPWSMLSHTANTSLCSSSRLATFCSRRALSCLGVRDQDGNASAAALMASSTSAPVLEGIWRSSFPVRGLKQSTEVVLGEDCRNPLLTKFCRRRGVAEDECRRAWAASVVLALQSVEMVSI